MTGRWNGWEFECVVVDLNTQRDFCDGSGADPVANIRELIPAMRHMIAWAKRNYAPVISSVEAHRPCELPDNGHPLCCVDGSDGQRKIDFTIFRQYVRVEVDNTLSCPIDLFRKHQQVIFRKRTNDLLGNPKADRFFTQLPTREFLLFGVSLESSIKALALGLLARDKRVTIVIDAGGYWIKGLADLAVRQIVSKGARVITVSKLLRRKLDRRRRYPSLRHGGSEADVTGGDNGQGHVTRSSKSHPLLDRLSDLPRQDSMPRWDEEGMQDVE